MNFVPLLLEMFRPFLLAITILTISNSCSNPNASGASLAQKSCGACHSVPSPALADKLTWQRHILPDMGRRLGFLHIGEGQYRAGADSAMSLHEWQLLVNYYIHHAPQQLPRPQKSVTIDSSLFEVLRPSHRHNIPVRTTLVQIDTVSHTLYTADGQDNQLYHWNDRLELLDTRAYTSPVVAILPQDSLLLAIGVLGPSNDTLGTIAELKGNTIVGGLQRPVKMLSADLNNDGLHDLIVCSFGHDQGGLYWFEKKPDGSFHKHPILEIPGAIAAEAGDFNDDGWTDLMVLFAHADEGLRLFLNNKNGGFIMKKILSFPPIQGSTSFQLVDFNKDGLNDILYTCGDNADLSKILKPYHGVYIFLNKGQDRYEQSFFYPINGCSKAIAADFDNDGDPDIATIAFFADFNNYPEESFLYFEQTSPLQFRVSSPKIEKYGRWLTMDAADYDGDGDIDILLGNFSSGFINDPTFRQVWTWRLPFIMMSNRTITSAAPPAIQPQ